CIASAEFTSRLLPLAETMLFGNQPFIADMTAAALSKPSTVAQQMRQRFARRAGGLFERLHGVAGLQVNQPQAGMFALINIASTGMNGDAYALDLLNKTGVAVMPGAAFGAALETWVRVALTIEDTAFDDACERIATHAEHCVSTRIKISA
ncbi:MAG: aminotransferase class I/II-fold pyridoxal phosphate-dependent enzyme, partial [Rhodobacterales bacterium]